MFAVRASVARVASAVSQAVHLWPDYVRRSQWFECPRCGARQEVSDHVWAQVKVMGEKPTLDCCEHRPHVPPSPSAVAAHEHDVALARLWGAVVGQ